MVQVGPHFPSSVLIYSLPLGLLAVATLHANNMRDIEGDALAGKHTLAAVLGLFVSRIVYLLLVLGAYAIIIYLGIPHKAPHLILIVLWTFPTLMVTITSVLRTNAPAGFHLLMRLTLKMEMFFAILLMIGLIATAIIAIIPHLPLDMLKF